MSYNLLEERWIPVLGTDGKAGRVGIRSVLAEAATIRQIAASNPMDNLALLRLLLAVLQWCKPDLTDDESTQLNGAGGIPHEWLKQLDDHKNKFELLGDCARFFQDQTQAKETPNRRVSDLFAYFPAGTEINHFRHVYDQTVALCAACCALGLTRLSACGMQGGQGKSPSINNAPPIYFIRVGNTLLETLLLNWPLQGPSDDDHPAWETGKQSKKKVGILEGFTWQPRTVWLGPLIQDAGMKCARCGAAEPLVSSLVFKKGRSRKGDKRAWRDPFVCLTTKNQLDNEGSDEKDTALRGPNPLKYPSLEAALWRQTARAVLESAGKDNPPIPSLRSMKMSPPHGSYLHMTCLEPFTKQAKTFDEHRDAWSIPFGVLQIDHRRRRALAEIDGLHGFNLRKLILRLKDPPRNTQEGPEIKSTEAIIAADIEHRLCKRFKRFVEELAKGGTDGEAEQCVKRWRKDVHDIFRKALDRACFLIAVGSPLRRREAAERAARALDREMEKLPKADTKEPTQGAADEPKRGRRKPGEA